MQDQSAAPIDREPRASRPGGTLEEGSHRASATGSLNSLRPRILPRPSGPSLLSLLDIGRDQLGKPVQYFDALGDTFTINWFGVPLIATRDPAWIEEVLIKQHKKFRKDTVTRGLSAVLGEGLLTSEGETWRRHRRMMAPHFHPGAIERYLDVFREEAERSMHGWRPGCAVDITRDMAQLTLRVVLRTVFGTDGSEESDFGDWVQEVMTYPLGVAGTWMTLPLWIPTSTNRRFVRARDALRAHALRLVEQAREKSPHGSVLRSLLAAEDGGTLTREELADEALTFLIAGHETSAITLSFALGLLAHHPDEQRALRADDTRCAATSNEQQRGTGRLARVIKESLRLFPPAWSMGREAVEDGEIAGVQVRQGTQVAIYQWATHRHPAWFPDSEAFRPERWQPEFEARLPRGLYLPFGAGPRQCIGNHFALAEITTVLQTLLERWEFSTVESFPPRLAPGVTLRSCQPVRLAVRPPP